MGYDLYRHSGAIEGEDYLRWVSRGEHREDPEPGGSRGLSLEVMSESDLNRLLTIEAVKIIRAHPWRYLNLSIHRATWCSRPKRRDPAGVVVRAMNSGFLVLLFGLVVLALWRNPDRGSAGDAGLADAGVYRDRPRNDRLAVPFTAADGPVVAVRRRVRSDTKLRTVGNAFINALRVKNHLR